MSKEIEATGWPCHKEKGAQLIGTGIDSNVYKVGDLVVKNYKLSKFNGCLNGLDISILDDYFLITNLAELYLKDNPTVLRSAGFRKKYPLTVNPFLKMNKCDSCGGVEGICKYIPGLRLGESYQRLGLYNLANQLTDISLTLGDKLGVTGIKVIPTNIKVTDENLIVITDLCADVSILRKIPA